MISKGQKMGKKAEEAYQSFFVWKGFKDQYCIF